MTPHQLLKVMNVIAPMHLGDRKKDQVKGRGVKNAFVIKQRSKPREENKNIIEDQYEIHRLMSINALEHLDIEDLSLTTSPSTNQVQIFEADAIQQNMSGSFHRTSESARSASASISLNLVLENESIDNLDTQIFHTMSQIHDKIEEEI